MKRLFSLSIVAALLLIVAACKPAEQERPALSLDTSAEVAPQAAALVADNNPQNAARLLVEWLADAPAADREFAMNLTREVYRLYTVSTDSGVLETFASTLELAKDSLPLGQQVNVFVAVSAPATLGQMLRNDPQADTIASLIVERYAADSASVTSFLNAFHSR